jgi:hypothetical protein
VDLTRGDEDDPHDFTDPVKLSAYKHEIVKHIEKLDRAKGNFAVAIAAVMKRQPGLPDATAALDAMASGAVALTPDEDSMYQTYPLFQGQMRRLMKPIKAALRPALTAVEKLARAYEKARVLEASSSSSAGEYKDCVGAAFRAVNKLRKEGPFLKDVAQFIKNHLVDIDAYLQAVVVAHEWATATQTPSPSHADGPEPSGPLWHEYYEKVRHHPAKTVQSYTPVRNMVAGIPPSLFPPDLSGIRT